MMLLLFLLFCTFAVGEKNLLNLPARFMWGWAPPDGLSGYCGSMSIQTVGLYYGNWITQDAARGTNGGHGPENQLLIPDSESHALTLLHLKHTIWDDENKPEPQHEEFIQWSRNAISDGDPVIFGVYMNGDDDADYDHIVPMVGFDDTGIYFNDLHANYSLRYEISDFVQTRKACMGGESEFDYCLPKYVNYGIQVHGNVDKNHELLPLSLEVDSWTEPDYSKEDGHNEKPILMHGNITISELKQWKKYSLLRYEDPNAVPDQKFLTNGGYTYRKDFMASDSIITFPTSFLTNSTIFYRCVLNPEL